MLCGFGAESQMLAALLEAPLASLPEPSERAYVAFDLDPARVQVRGWLGGWAGGPPAGSGGPPQDNRTAAGSAAPGALGGPGARKGGWGLPGHALFGEHCFSHFLIASLFSQAARAAGYNVVYGDGSRTAVLKAAGINRPRAVVVSLATQVRGGRGWL